MVLGGGVWDPSLGEIEPKALAGTVGDSLERLNTDQVVSWLKWNLKIERRRQSPPRPQEQLSFDPSQIGDTPEYV